MDKPPCEVCAAIYEAKGEEPICWQCRPVVMDQNVDAFRIFPVVCDQELTIMDVPFALNIGTVIQVMDLYGIKDKIHCLGNIREMYGYFAEERRLRRST